jgi:uncharacterized metal-binding protein
MRYGIPLLGNRVAPRCTCADCMLVVTLARGRITTQDRVPLDITNPLNLLSGLRTRRVDTLVCGGIGPQAREMLAGEDIGVIDNVACSADEVLSAIAAGRLRSDYGFGAESRSAPGRPALSAVPVAQREAAEVDGKSRIDCLACRNRVCLRGETCAAALLGSAPRVTADAHRMLEAATDISTEEERQLCRLAELVYFCLEMQFRRIGIAFCEDLREPAQVLYGVLGRSFETVPVCCKAGGPPGGETQHDAERPGPASVVPPVTCNPVAQARLLNRAGTELNVIVGLCMGADCVFTRESDAPVTTLFVKDRSLANNPIGAVYSEYYLRESVTTARPWPTSDGTGHQAASHHRLSENHSAREELS